MLDVPLLIATFWVGSVGIATRVSNTLPRSQDTKDKFKFTNCTNLNFTKLN